MHEPNSQKIMDYTTVPAGLMVEGHLSTGQTTAATDICPKCGRMGVTAQGHAGPIVVHSGRIDGNTLVGIDYCSLRFEATH